ncbi:conserved hypothetical protein [Synechococcus sp. PCC 7335]|uniref:DUF433 domain-containing protein n=1 Tax=Synechococcus sp. (strain ATCC 29403 / PCC 7335) TaxID=91464 RepID=UPI00017EE02C|nr:DUF433 domain-containing protein [Synechococcus sp. PCC 7335]EDX84765.1 conserved hypothetical protein [Synechococcus sp. PCC 7335]
MTSTYEQLDIRNVATYPVADAARYLAIPAGTLRSWLHGRTYPTANGNKYFEPLIHLPDGNSPQLSFTNLVEAHVLRVIRQNHKVRLDKVRTALDYVEQKFGLPHPLARAQFQTDGVDLFVESVGQLINASRDGQLAMKKTLQQFLQRIEWDEEGHPQRLFPLIQLQQADEPRVLEINPRLSFGRPVVVNTGIPANMIIDRFRAGESLESLADDYDLSRQQLEEILRFEMVLSKAA